MRLSRPLVTVAALAMLATAAGCGGDDEPASGSTAPGATTSAAGGGETDSPSGGLTDICTVLTEAEVSSLLGGPVTVEEVPGGGCNFSNEDDPRATSVQVTSSVVDEGAGGFEGSVAGISGVLQGDDGEALAGVGDQAYVKTGTFGGGSELVRGSGLVRVGSTVVQVDLSPEQGTSGAKVRSIVVDTLTLIATKA